ncbi:MAG: ABC transporter ATP-binding protein [Candidatus Sericytochromatia bacterium]|nr:ABC transporter ATP-binding protein [Candidatus Sericytochromatia bacterium]
MTAGDVSLNDPDEYVIRTVGLNKIFGGAIAYHALHDIDLAIRPGEMVALMGASGSGKSTLMNILGCLDRPTSGSYFLKGKPVGDYSDNALAEIRNGELGFVFQSFNLLARVSALQNVELPMLYSPISRRERVARATATLTRLGLGDRLRNGPSELSGGQKQRVAIARAIVNEPTILFADEPTGALDTKTSYEIMQIFQALNDKGITVVVVTHEPDIASYCKRLLRMQDGRLVADEPVAQVRLDT